MIGTAIRVISRCFGVALTLHAFIAHAEITPIPEVQQDLERVLGTGGRAFSEEDAVQIDEYALQITDIDHAAKVSFLEQLLYFLGQSETVRQDNEMYFAVVRLGRSAGFVDKDLLKASAAHWLGAPPRLANEVNNWIQAATRSEYSYEDEFNEFIPYMKESAGGDGLPPEGIIDYLYYRDPKRTMTALSVYYGESEVHVQQLKELLKALPTVSYGNSIGSSQTEESRALLLDWKNDSRWWIRYGAYSMLAALQKSSRPEIIKQMTVDTHIYVRQRGERLLAESATRLPDRKPY